MFVCLQVYVLTLTGVFDNMIKIKKNVKQLSYLFDESEKQKTNLLIAICHVRFSELKRTHINVALDAKFCLPGTR